MPDSSPPERDSTFVCECGEEMRSACAGEPFYNEHEGKRYCVLHLPRAEKSADFQKAFQKKLDSQNFDFCGVWFPGDLPFGDFTFTTDTNFSEATFNASADFSSATFVADTNFSAAKFGGAVNFRGVSFNDVVNFNDSVFRGEADFRESILTGDTYFNTVSFEGNADFRGSNFSADTYFTEVRFQGEADFGSVSFSASVDFNTSVFLARADFEQATFGALVYFSASRFSAGVSFKSANFAAAVDFRSAAFSSLADFSFATFTDTVRFPGVGDDGEAGLHTSFDFKFAIIKSPESFSFPSGVLRPHWFINIDLREFDLANIQWRSNPSEEVRSLERQIEEMPQGSSPSRLLSDAYRRMALSAEDNHHYQDASLFRYGSMDSRRKKNWGGFAFWRTDLLHWIYWATSGYGERILRAFFWLVGIWFISALLYTLVGFDQKAPKVVNDKSAATEMRDEVRPLPFRRALIYSVGVMTLQKPEPRPSTGAGQTIVLLETVLGPVQAALMALAIRRKFMTA